MKTVRMIITDNTARLYAPLSVSSKEIKLDGRKKGVVWRPFAAEELKSKKRTGNIGFLTTWDGNMVFREEFLFKHENLRTFLLTQGELLLFTVRDTQFKIFNCTNLVDALDHSKTIWDEDEEGSLLGIEKHVFVDDKLDGVSLFKVPEEARSTLYLALGDRALQNCFEYYIDKCGLRGIELKPVE